MTNVTSVPTSWNGRGHFFAAAAEAMRRILIESARRKRAEKHGGDLERIDLDGVDLPEVARSEEILAVDEALSKLAAEDPAKAELVKLRYFGGLSVEDAGRVLGISRATADRYGAFARVWLEAGPERKRRVAFRQDRQGRKHRAEIQQPAQSARAVPVWAARPKGL